MALKFFDDEPNSSGSLPFAKDYLEENPRENKKEFEIEEFWLVQSNKGYMFRTDKFIGFLFKNQKTTKQILEALKYYTENQDGYALVAVLDKGAKNSYRLGVDFDKPTSWFTSGNERYATHELDSGQDINGNANPFLPPVPSNPSGVTAATPRNQRNGKGGTRGLEAMAPSAS